MERLLTIGEFAERCGLSRSALRFYDQNDLLRPQLVDEDSGYRYYALGQLDQALLVCRLRAAEMGVAVLRRYLAASPERRRALLDEHLTSFRRRASQVERAIVDLRGDLERAAEHPDARCCALAPAAFAEALAQVSFAIADPVVRAELGVVWVETKDDSLRLVATDSYRLAVRDLLPERLGTIAIRGAIDSTAATALMRALRTADELVLSQHEDGTMSAVLDGCPLAIGDRGEGFPDYERILLGLPVGDQVAVSRAEVDDALAQLPEVEQLRVELTADGLVLQAADRRLPVTGEWSGAPLTMLLDRGFVTDAVAAMVGPDLVIEASDPLRPLTLRSADTGAIAVLTMPIGPPDPA